MLVAAAAGPSIGVLLELRWQLRGERTALARSIAQQQAELVHAGMGTLVDNARQVLAMASTFATVQRLDAACGERLDRLRAQLPNYRMLAVVMPDGVPVCSSASPALPPAAVRAIAAPLLGATSFTTGRFASEPDQGQPMLSFASPIARSGPPAGLVVAGLDLAALDGVLRATEHRPSARTIVRDAAGTVLASRPGTVAVVGETRPNPPGADLDGAVSGTVLLPAVDGASRVLGYVPAGRKPLGISVATGMDVADISLGIDQAERRGTLLIVVAAACSLVLSLLFGQRYLRAPAAVLLRAARRWGVGDLTARAFVLPGAAAELGQLAGAFNEMAQTLQEQRTELRSLNEALELRVAERTRALLDSNNRLQVEIAERELTESQLRQAQKLQAVGQLAGGMAHEFNNLLTVVLGSIDLLRARLADKDPRHSRLLDTASRAVDRGSRLTAQLLTFSRRQPLLAISMDVGEAIERITGMLSTTLDAAIRIQWHVADALWPATLDPNQFEAAILNLALNARDAMPAGGRLSIVATNHHLAPGADGSGLPPGDYVRIVVSDTGAGMSAEVASRAFEPFFTTKAPGQGAGLGLSQVHGMAHQLGGSVRIASQPGDGAAVTMMLPRSQAAPERRREGDEHLLPALTRDQAVLLVDDDQQVREVTAATLTESGYTVLTAADANSGLDVLQQEGERVAFVIADHIMPGMTGRDMLDLVRKRRPDVAILLATGFADSAELLGDGLAVEQVVRKPFHAAELLARMQALIDRPVAETTQTLP